MGAILKTPPTASKEDIVNTLNLAQITMGSGIDQSNTGKDIIISRQYLRVRSWM